MPHTLPAMPVISIITVVYNGEKLLEPTIKSVISQSYPNIEYIIVDGCSKDRTLDIVRSYEKHISKWISEKDKGIYDAMNKGLSLATGDYVLFMNAGDVLYASDTIEKVFASARGADVYYGETEIVNEEGKSMGDRRLKPPAHLDWKSLRFGMCVSHQSFIPKRALCPPYDLQYKISSDIDWVINILKRSTTTVHTHTYISRFLAGGTSRQKTIKALRERFRLMIKHYGVLTVLGAHVIMAVKLFFYYIRYRRLN